MSVVVDASVVIKWFVPEAGSDAASRLLASEDRLEAPDLLFAEIANAIWKKVQRGQLTRAESRLLVRDIEKSPWARRHVAHLQTTHTRSRSSRRARCTTRCTSLSPCASTPA